MTPFGPEALALFRLIGDGEWHAYDELMDRLADSIPPGKALRCYEKRRDRRREANTTERAQPEPSEWEKIGFGQRLLANSAFQSVKRRYLEIDPSGGGYGKNHVRLKPGVELPGVRLDRRHSDVDRVEGAEADSEDDDRVEPRPNSAGVTDDVFAEGWAALPREERAEMNQIFNRLDEQTRNLVEGYLHPIAPQDAVSSDVVDTAPVVVMSAEVEAEAAESAPEAPERHVAASPTVTAVPAVKDEMALFSEAEVRSLVAQEVGQALDRFQEGMQRWLADRLSELERRSQPAPAPPCAFGGWALVPSNHVGGRRSR